MIVLAVIAVVAIAVGSYFAFRSKAVVGKSTVAAPTANTSAPAVGGSGGGGIGIKQD
jgi:hypothetical protein